MGSVNDHIVAGVGADLGVNDSLISFFSSLEDGTVGQVLTKQADGTTRYAAAAGGLDDDGTYAATTTDVLKTRVSGDTQPRFALNADGTLEWGPGNAALDFRLGRNNPGGFGIGLHMNGPVLLFAGTDPTLYISSAGDGTDSVYLTQVSSGGFPLLEIGDNLRVASRVVFGGSTPSAGIISLFTTPVAGDSPVVVRGAASQTADLLKVQNSTSTDLITVSSSGKMFLRGAAQLTEVLETRIQTDTGARFKVNSAGTFVWGDGAGVEDFSLGRAGGPEMFLFDAGLEISGSSNEAYLTILPIAAQTGESVWIANPSGVRVFSISAAGNLDTTQNTKAPGVALSGTLANFSTLIADGTPTADVSGIWGQATGYSALAYDTGPGAWTGLVSGGDSANKVVVGQWYVNPSDGGTNPRNGLNINDSNGVQIFAFGSEAFRANTDGLQMLDNKHIQTNTTTGTKFGISNLQKIGFWGATPRVRPGPWATPTGTADRTTFDTATVLLGALAQRVKALIDDLFSAGLIGP